MKELLKAYENIDPAPNRQKAVTPGFLKEVRRVAWKGGVINRHTADLAIGGFFFAMRACEFCHTPRKGRTKRVTLGNISFRDEQRKLMDHNAENLSTATFVTITFVDQKNGKKQDKRTQRRTDSGLCPVKTWARIVRRCRDQSVRHPNQDHEVCQIGNVKIDSERVKRLLRLTCQMSQRQFGFNANELGTRSIRSGAAMALFLSDEPTEKIKILGRWSSDAFLVYIRPQVLEWTNLMSTKMAEAPDFTDMRATPLDKISHREIPGLLPRISRDF